MEIIYIVRKKQAPPLNLWSISYLLLSDLQALLLVVISPALQLYTPIRGSCMLQTHPKYLSSFLSLHCQGGENNTDITDRLNTLRSFLTSSREHQFPTRQTFLTGEAPLYQQQGNTGKNLCTASSGQWVQSLK